VSDVQQYVLLIFEDYTVQYERHELLEIFGLCSPILGVKSTFYGIDSMTLEFYKARSVAEPAAHSQDCEKTGIPVVNISKSEISMILRVVSNNEVRRICKSTWR
jgi:hypothetical protein